MSEHTDPIGAHDDDLEQLWTERPTQYSIHCYLSVDVVDAEAYWHLWRAEHPSGRLSPMQIGHADSGELITHVIQEFLQALHRAVEELFEPF